MRSRPDRLETAWLPLLVCAFAYALVLIASISRSSLWTDEAFSAWQASHQTLRSFGSSLFAGDSSDLQMGLYYLYLFGWVKLFGMSEYALRAANIPFIVLFGLALVWTSWRVFQSRAAWVAAAMLPFTWHYATEARSYMAVLAFSTASLASVLGFIRAESVAAAKRFPWLALTCLAAGSLFHMLYLLAAPGMLLLLAFAYWPDRSNPRWRLWKKPLIAFAPLLLAMAAFFCFTFLRGPLGYPYPRPGIRQMASVIYELAGLSNFGPERKFSVDLSGYHIPLALGGAAILLSALGVAWSVARRRPDRTLRDLGLTACVSCAALATLSWTMKKQFDARHLAALVPVMLFLLLAASRASRTRLMAASLTLLSGAWLAADVRGLLVPEYQKEDYREAVKTVLSAHNRTGGEIVLASDPVGPAYYGLDVRGPAPCYPIVFDCADAFRRVPWPHYVPAWNGAFWSDTEIRARLEQIRKQGTPVIILHQLARSRLNLPWWPILAEYPGAPRLRLQGLEIIVLQ